MCKGSVPTEFLHFFFFIFCMGRYLSYKESVGITSLQSSSGRQCVKEVYTYQQYSHAPSPPANPPAPRSAEKGYLSVCND